MSTVADVVVETFWLAGRESMQHTNPYSEYCEPTSVKCAADFVKMIETTKETRKDAVGQCCNELLVLIDGSKEAVKWLLPYKE